MKLVEERLAQFPVVALLGPRQVGKTTLAKKLSRDKKSIYLDLENPVDIEKVNDPLSYFQQYQDRMIILDEVQRLPDIFQVLRGVVDHNRQGGNDSGQFLLLGSASIDLLQQSSESLAGRIAYTEMTPFSILEVSHEKQQQLWIRGGFPNSFLAATEKQSVTWRSNFIQTYLERDIPMLGPKIPATTLRRFWTMLAHLQGRPFNAATIAKSLAVDAKTVARYLDLMVDLLLVRRLQPYHANTKKRLIKSPKVYLRDSGLLHTLLRLDDSEDILSHPITGESWEGFVIESLIGAAPVRTVSSYYRTSAGAEIDLVLDIGGKHGVWAIEIKRSSAAKISKGFHNAIEDIKADKAFVVYAGEDRYQKGSHIEAIGLTALCQLLQACE